MAEASPPCHCCLNRLTHETQKRGRKKGKLTAPVLSSGKRKEGGGKKKRKKKRGRRPSIRIDMCPMIRNKAGKREEGSKNSTLPSAQGPIQRSLFHGGKKKKKGKKVGLVLWLDYVNVLRAKKGKKGKKEGEGGTVGLIYASSAAMKEKKEGKRCRQ